MCPQAKTNPNLYKKVIDDGLTTYWSQCVFYITDENMRENYWSQWEDNVVFYFDNMWYVELDVLSATGYDGINWLSTNASYWNYNYMGAPEIYGWSSWEFAKETDYEYFSDYYFYLEQFQYCATFDENLFKLRFNTTLVRDNPCLSWHDSSTT